MKAWGKGLPLPWAQGLIPEGQLLGSKGCFGDGGQGRSQLDEDGMVVLDVAAFPAGTGMLRLRAAKCPRLWHQGHPQPAELLG